MTAFPRKIRPLALLNLLGSGWLGFVCLAAALLLVVPAHAGDEEPFDLDAVLALESGQEMVIISPDNIVKVCSEALKTKESLPTEVVAQLFLRRGGAFAVLEKYKEAKKDAEESLKLSPDLEKAALLRAQVLYQLGDIEEAQKEVAGLAKKNPRSAKCFLVMGAMLCAGGKVEDGVNAYSKAIELDPREALAYFHRAKCRLNNEDYAGCVEDMKRCVELRPLIGWTNEDQASPYLILGEAYLLLRKNDQALAAFEMARRLNPASFEAAYGMWSSCHEAGRFRMSYALAPRLIRLDDKDPQAYLALARSANATLRVGEAIRAAEQALTLDPRLAQAHNELAAAYAKEGRYDLAIQELERALKIEPDNIGALSCKAYLLATCPEKKYRDGPKARELATKACKAKDYKDYRTLTSLAAAEAECGDFKEAVRLQKQGLLLLDAKGATVKEEFEKVLELFEKGQPYREEYEPKPPDDGLDVPDPTEP